MSQERTATSTEGTTERSRPHKSGHAAFKAIMSEDIDWKPFAAFPPPAPGCCLAVVVGEPSEKGPYMIRVKVPGISDQTNLFSSIPA